MAALKWLTKSMLLHTQRPTYSVVMCCKSTMSATPEVSSYVQWLKDHFMEVKSQRPHASSQELLDECRARYKLLYSATPSRNNQQDKENIIETKPKRTHKKYTTELLGNIVRQIKAGKLQKDVSEETKISKSQISKIFTKYKDDFLTEEECKPETKEGAVIKREDKSSVSADLEKKEERRLRRRLINTLEDLGKPRRIQSAYEMFTADFYQKYKVDMVESTSPPGQLESPSPPSTRSPPGSASPRFTEHYQVLQESLEKFIHNKRTFSTSHTKIKTSRLNYTKDIIPVCGRLWNDMSESERAPWQARHSARLHEYTEERREWEVSLEERGLHLLTSLKNVNNMDKEAIQQTLDFIHKKTKPPY